MKILRAVLLASAAVFLASAFAEPARAEVSFEFAYSNLSPHGTWLVSAQYGRVWQPREYRREWNPYYDGHWADTDMGWTWVSDYGWGAIPYHYGTWYLDPHYGWVWIPGQIWAPSWVVFRTAPEYIGWYPVPPGFSVGVSMEFGSPSSFVYVSSRDFLAPSLRGSIIPQARTSVFINHTTVVNNIVVQNNVVINHGPDVASIERATGHPVRRQSIDQVARVAPFEHVTREQLAVAPDRAKRALRVVEPVPESRPLPTADRRGQPDKQQPEKSKASTPKDVPSSQGHGSQAPVPEARTAKPANVNEHQQPAHKPQADVKAQSAQPPPKEPAATVAQKPQSSQPAHKTAPVAPTKQAQKSPPPSKTEQDASAAAKHEATTNAATPQKAKPPAKDKAKKDSPEKQDKEPEKENPPPKQ